MAGVATNLLSPARVAGLDYAHQVGVVTLFLRLAATGSGICDIEAILGHNLHTREMRKVGNARLLR